ncbi:heavy metal-associated isoprenylated plant protein 7-like [Cucurbita pepo subsp. pepo]|uniref:heavy metal-associated isoprenylated plant protein 7-like n=1 Tax=Cucurbita pepo subsp. pepo TaxID=3664 RepID=UPI000C9D5DAF|nr:heavy metal-associated isoprenylated plant protein 7-like [Cucurbita pepo subsp. pepo]
MGEQAEKKKTMGESMAQGMEVQKPAPVDANVKEKEEESKPLEKSAPEKEDKKTEESKEGKEQQPTKEEVPPPPPPPPEIVLKVYMHCEGCARKVRRCLRGFEGVEDVITDCKTHKVVVKGDKADPLKVLNRIQRKSHRQVELLSPIPKPPSPEELKAAEEEEKEKPKPEEKKEEPPIVTVVLRVHMHCEACAQEIKKRILRMKGVDAVEPDLKGSQVSVTGAFDPPKLVEYVHKRTGKHAVIVKTDPEKKEKEGEAKEVKEEEKAGEESGKEKKGDGGGGGSGGSGNGDEKESSKEAEGGGGGGEGKTGVEVAAEEERKVVELKKSEYYTHYPQRYAMEMYAYPPQIFSDENPNACSVM